MIDKYSDFFICYNWMPLVADHCIDFSYDEYKNVGVTPLHDCYLTNLADVKKNDIVFVKTDFLYSGHFQNIIFPNIDNEFILMTGGSDYIVGHDGDRSSHLKMLEDKKIKKWFCINPPNIISDKLIPMPIGFQEIDRMGGNQNNIKFALNNQKIWTEKKNMFYLPYHALGNNPARNSYISYLKTLDFVYVEENKLSFSEYLQKMSEYKFIICLRGNGFDTHRHYESLLVGSVPIIENTPVRMIYENDNLPHIVVQQWADITKEFFNHVLVKKYSFDIVSNFLTVRFHAERIKQYAKS
jgi:hypothetical protein